MRILRQILIILGVWLAGELLAKLLHLPIPGNVVGMLLMLILLQTHVIRIEKISRVATFFLDNLSFFFIPGSVALMVCYRQVGGDLPFALIAVVCSSILVFLVTGFSTEYLLRFAKKRKEQKHGSSENNL